jgi:hypothetical protein
MNNQAQGRLCFNVVYNTEWSFEEFLLKMHDDNIIGAEIKLVLSDGSEHKMTFCDFVTSYLTSFSVDGEEILDQEEDKEKATQLIKLSDKMKFQQTVTAKHCLNK